MATRQHRPSRLRRLVLPAITSVFLSYFAYHAFHGEYGIVGRARFDSEITQLNRQLDQLVTERKALETRVALMRTESLDQDMVDERARFVLNLVNPNEVAIMLEPAAVQHN